MLCYTMLYYTILYYTTPQVDTTEAERLWTINMNRHEEEKHRACFIIDMQGQGEHGQT